MARYGTRAMATAERKQLPLPKKHAVPARPSQARRAGDDYGCTAQPDWREVDWPAQLNWIEIEGRKVNYVDMGSGAGPPVVFIHGLSGQWQNWLENIPRAAQERRVIAMDLPGFGYSEDPVEQITIPGYARCVEELCERLDLGSVAVVGNSMGGFIAAEMAIRFPGRVERLMLCSPAGVSSAQVRERPVMTMARIAGISASTQVAPTKLISKRPGLRHLILALVARHPSRLKSDLTWHGLVSGAGKPAFVPALGACLNYDFRERLGEIGCPTLLIWGRNDAIIPVEDAELFERLVPGLRTVILKDTGHVAMVERPEVFNGLLMDFVAEKAGESTTPDEKPEPEVEAA